MYAKWTDQLLDTVAVAKMTVGTFAASQALFRDYSDSNSRAQKLDATWAFIQKNDLAVHVKVSIPFAQARVK